MKLIVLTLVMIYSICFTANAKETDTDNNAAAEEKAFVNIDVNGDIKILDGVFMNEEARKTLDAVNALRAEKGVEPLVWANDFDLLGKLRAAEIQEIYSHSRPNGEARIIIKDGKTIVTGENIAIGYMSAEEVMAGWTKSLGHYENMTDVDYQSYYCACFVTYDPEYGWPWYTWVQLFSFDKLDSDEKESNITVPGNNTITIQSTEDTGNTITTTPENSAPVDIVIEHPVVEEEPVVMVIEYPYVEEEPVVMVINQPAVEEKPIVMVIVQSVVEEKPVDMVIEQSAIIN